MNNKTTLIFDIETIPRNWSDLDKELQDYLLKNTETKDEEQAVKDKLALLAPTSEIVAIAIYELNSQSGAVYFQAPNQEKVDYKEDNIRFYSGTEKEILEKFWRVIISAQTFVTFNGRNFDCPVLMLRSAFLSVKPSRNLLPYRYDNNLHVDLLDQLSFYGASRRFSLDMYCRFFGIKSPKADGLDGSQVNNLFQQGEYEKIAKYCLGDVLATKELYLKWQNFLKF